MTRATFCVIAAISLAVLACNDDDGAAGRQLDPSQLTNSSGEVALSDGGTMAFTITSERYKQWDAAQRSLDKRVAKRFGQLLQPASPSERSLSSAVAYLEQEPRARQAIEKAGLTVRGFVELTVALEQQMRLAGGGGGTPRSAPPPPPTYTAQVDSGYLPVPPPSTPAPTETRPIPQTRTDTLFPAPVRTPAPLPAPVTSPTPPAPTADPVPSRDTTAPPRDTSSPKRDPVPTRSDTAVTPKPPASDTLPSLPHIRPAS